MSRGTFLFLCVDELSCAFLLHNRVAGLDVLDFALLVLLDVTDLLRVGRALLVTFGLLEAKLSFRLGLPPQLAVLVPRNRSTEIIAL